ncbi:MAG: efflux RND transporter periplasmic adaptor subunit [Acidobacteriota bacterium]
MRKFALIAALLTLTLQAADAPSGDETRVEKGSFTKHLIFSGELEAAESFLISVPRVSTWDNRITYLAPEGSVVQPGDLLVRFDTSEMEMKRLDLEKTKEESLMTIAQKEAEIDTGRQDLLLTKAAAEKTANVAALFIDIEPQLIPRADAEKYEFDYEKAKIDLQIADERLAALEESAEEELQVLRLDLQKAELELQRVLTDLERLEIRAPAEGLVVYEEDRRQDRKIQVGDTVFQGRPLMRLPNLERLRVLASVYDVDFTHLEPGMQAEVTLDSEPDRTFKARIESIAQVAQPVRRDSSLNTFSIYVDLLEQDLNIMKPGMTARVQIPVVSMESLIVPREALHVNERGEVYILRKEAPADPVLVSVMDANFLSAAVAGDLQPGDVLLSKVNGDQQQASTQVDWMPIKREDLTFAVSGSGMLEAEIARDIGPPAVPNHSRFKIMRMIPEGTNVAEGDFLLAFDPTEVRRRLRDEQANLQKVKQEYEKTESSLKTQQKDLELELEEAKVQREKADNKLIESKEFASAIEVRQAEYEAILARQRVEMLQQKLVSLKRNAELQLRMLEESEVFYQKRVKANQEGLARMEVKAPIVGTVIYKANWNNEKRQVGDDVWVADKILSIPDLSTLMIRGQVSEVDAGKIKLGQAVRVTLDALPEQTFNGQVVRIDTMFKKASQERPIKVLEIKVQLDRLDPRRMRPDMVARLQVVIDDFRDVIAVPLSVIEVDENGTSVWVNENGRPVRRAIRVGKDNGIVAIVESGLEVGEQVASRPLS